MSFFLKGVEDCWRRFDTAEELPRPDQVIRLTLSRFTEKVLNRSMWSGGKEGELELSKLTPSLPRTVMSISSNPSSVYLVSSL